MNKYNSILQSLKPGRSEPLESNSKVLIIDGTNTYFRCFTAVNLLNADLVHIGGLVGFLKSICYAIKMIVPTKVIILFDGQGSNTNKKYLYPDYKANRDIQKIKNWQFDTKAEETEAMISQLERLIQYLQCLPIHLLVIDKIEADDVIGHLCNKFSKKITIMSSDRDFLQLVNEDIEVYIPTKKKFYNPKEVFEEYGIYSQNFIFYKTLLGDKGDNVPGIKGIGPKKVIKYFPELTKEKKLSLVEILEICEEKEYINILEKKQQLEINYKLMDLGNPNIPESELETIEKVIDNSNKTFEKNTFIQMYKDDKLGEAIPRLDIWLDNFRHLTAF